MIHSLRFKLLFGVLLVLGLTTLISAWFSINSVKDRFQQFILQGESAERAILDMASYEPDSRGLMMEIYYFDVLTGQREFLDSVTQALAVVVVVAGSIALVMILSLAHPSLRMIEAMTTAAKRMASGDLRQRVEVHSNDEISQLARSFNELASSLARNEQVRRSLVSDIAHELRTPLSNLQGYLEGLRDGVIEPETVLFDSLYQECAVLTRLVNDLQELALVESRQLKLVCQPVELREIVAATVLALLPDAQANQIDMRDHVPRALPMVYADADRVGQMVRNLLRNAITHTPAGGRIEVVAIHENEMVNLRVSDTGYGIQPEHLPYVFERFYRADRSRARATGGSGLGLAIVRQLAEAHGGSVSVTSTPGKGSTFVVSLPTVGRALGQPT